jgi:hypothetical protein
VISIHKQYKNNKDSHFKTFVCIALKYLKFNHLPRMIPNTKFNLSEKKLVVYLKQILKTSSIIENYYQSWSYVKQTGFKIIYNLIS